MAECHPVGFQWVTEAQQRGARVIHVDPRFTRTSAVADRHIALRAGSDIVLLGALINYVLSNDLWFDEYVRAYTNAATVISEDYRGAEDLDGLFSGYNPEDGTYGQPSWSYQSTGGEEKVEEPGEEPEGAEAEPQIYGAGGPALSHADLARDETLQDPHCVFQILKRHYARYTPEMVERACGISAEDFNYMAESVTQNSGRERTTAFAYAVGWTQHAQGAQFIRTAAILQLLLGNIGRPGGGILALRGHATIQGSTDIPTLFNLLPGYLPMPEAAEHHTLDQYISAIRSPKQKGYWTHADAYTISLLKAWWGDAAQQDNDFAFDYLPRLTGAHGTYQTVERMLNDELDGYFLLGQNPAVGSANGKMQRMGMSRLKWLVVRDFNLIESATWWKEGPEIETGELRTEEIETEVFYLPAANHTEKAGSFTQTQRLVQWRHQAVTPPDDAQSELHFFYELGKRIRERLAGSQDWRDRPLLDLTWDYPTDRHGEPDPEAVLAEINGFHTTGPDKDEPLSSYTQMRPDGSTAGGCWIYTGVYADRVNQAARRKPGHQQDETAAEWAWAWPANRRLIYNRASADPQGRPWSERKKYVWWDAHQQSWTGKDVPDFPAGLAPDARPDPDQGGPEALAGDDPFIMQADGKGWLFAPNGVVDGPLPTHYEPPESPIANPLYGQQSNPARVLFPRSDNLLAPWGTHPGSEIYPHVFTTYRLTEHHTAGGMSRFLPYLAELQPEMFCEVSPEFAEAVGLEPYGWATIISPRSAIEARVFVTERMKSLTIEGRRIHQVGLPYHWGRGSHAAVEGDAANDLLGLVLDPNVLIQGSKASQCAVRPGRRPRGPALLTLVEGLRRQAGLSVETSNERLTVPWQAPQNPSEEE